MLSDYTIANQDSGTTELAQGRLDSLITISGAKLPRRPLLWDVSISNGKIASIDPHHFNRPDVVHKPGTLEANGRLLAPSLCHAHIHLDKCFLLQDSKFSDLEIVKGDFQEAMTLTTKAKARFEKSDLFRRGRQVVVESINYGVTSMRAFVEVDGDVMFKCLDVGLQLKKEFAERCEIQICAFAQLPLYSGEDDGDLIRKLMEEAASRDGVDVLGSTPYVEDSEFKEKENVRWISNLALSRSKFLDLHLDYHLDITKKPLTGYVFDLLRRSNWKEYEGKAITLGHCTRLTHLKPEEWRRLKQEIGELPVSFVGLPTSDLFMMRTKEGYRGTLHVPDMIYKYGFQAAIAINNVGNAFTPQGNCDPLSVASLCVGLYCTGTKSNTELLYDCVSSRAKQVVGLPSSSLDLKVGEPADFVLFEKAFSKLRTRKSIAEVVYDPIPGRITIRNGKVTNG
ncbi:cytosine deaminase protein-like protein [Tothia fuscella]|uniref:Cytosine deaminase protein-like protein n=1 Tax=Tothia fuscella TaxID=1048955 RepID=A0A9P4TSF1_9PEZI|nr:cytosine deaminase protein-like protein [Tothia fuscella]